MKNIFNLLLTIALIGALASCQPAKIVTTKDAVKSVQTTTADYYDFVIDGRRGTLKDASYFIAPLLISSPDLMIKMVKGCDRDEGYWIPAPAKAGNATTLAPSDNTIEELEIQISQLRPSVFPQRGN